MKSIILQTVVTLAGSALMLSSTAAAASTCRTELEWANEARFTCEGGGYLVTKVKISDRCLDRTKFGEANFSCGTESKRTNKKAPWLTPDEIKPSAEWIDFAAWTCLVEGGVATRIKLKAETIDMMAKGVSYTCVVPPEDGCIDTKIPTNSCNSSKVMTEADMGNYCSVRLMTLTANDAVTDCGNGSFARGTFRCCI